MSLIPDRKEAKVVLSNSTNLNTTQVFKSQYCQKKKKKKKHHPGLKSYSKNVKSQLGDPITQGAEAERARVRGQRSSVESSSLAWVKQGGPVSKNQKNKQKNAVIIVLFLIIY
jgi:hypothetical protein